MSWYLFKQSPAIQYRGKKVAGFEDMHRPKVNISWGLNENLNKKAQVDIFPSTIIPRQQYNSQHNNMKVLTESSDNQEQLVMLIKNQNDKRNQKQILDMYNKSKSKHHAISQQEVNQNRGSNKGNSQRIKYLQQNLLPASKRDNMNAVLNHDLNKSIPLSQSQVSYRSSFHNKKNDSTVQLGNGFNVFNPPIERKKQLTDELRERYDYEERCKQRIQRSNFILG